MCGSGLSAFKAQLTILSTDTNEHDCTITSYVGAVNHSLKWYATDAVLVKIDVEIRNFEQGSLMAWAILKSCGTSCLVAKAYTTNRCSADSYLKKLESASAEPCDVGGRITEKLGSKTSPTKRSALCTYNTGIGGRSRRMVNGPESLKEPTRSERNRKITARYDILRRRHPSSSDKNGPLSQRSWAQVMKQITSAASSKHYESDSSLMDSGTYGQI